MTLLLAGAWVPVPAASLIWDILKIVVLPVLAGLLLNAFRGERLGGAVALFPLISVCGIMAIIASIVALNAETLFSIGPAIFGAVALHNLLGMGLAYAAARIAGMDARKAKAITFETGMQNSGLAAALSLQFFSAAAAIPGVIFSVWQNLSAPALAAYWKRKE